MNGPLCSELELGSALFRGTLVSLSITVGFCCLPGLNSFQPECEHVAWVGRLQEQGNQEITCSSHSPKHLWSWEERQVPLHPLGVMETVWCTQGKSQRERGGDSWFDFREYCTGDGEASGGLPRARLEESFLGQRGGGIPFCVTSFFSLTASRFCPLSSIFWQFFFNCLGEVFLELNLI